MMGRCGVAGHGVRRRSSVPPTPPDPAPDSPPVPLAERAPRAATGVFGVLLAVAAVVYAVQGRAQWFFQDEWVFLAERDASSIHGLLDPHNEHWVTAPLVAYRLLWNVVGARRYEPYQALAIASHLLVVVLLHLLLRRRLAISPWVAVAASALVAFTGTGSENVVWAFQITFTGSLGAGLAAMLLADHPHPSPARRLATWACGLLSLMCSGVGVVMVGVLGLALLARRGVRAAAAATLPVVAIYGAWHLAFASGSTDPGHDVGLIVRFVRIGLTHAVRGIGPTAWAVYLLLALTAVGGVLVVWDGRRSLATLRHRLAIPVAMGSGLVAFFVLTGSTRAVTQGLAFATRGRYAYVALVLLVPAVALAVDTVVRRWPPATVPVLVLLVAGIPANVGTIEARTSQVVPPALVTAVAASPALADAPADHVPFEALPGFRAITAGWLREQVASGKVPTSGAITAEVEAEAIARLTLVVGEPWAGGTRCHELPPGGEEVAITEDRPVAYVGKVQVQALGPRDGRSRPRRFGTLEPRTLATVGAPVTVLVVPLPGVWNASLCR